MREQVSASHRRNMSSHSSFRHILCARQVLIEALFSQSVARRDGILLKRSVHSKLRLLIERW